MPFYQLSSLLYVQRNLRLTYKVKVAGLSDQLNVTEKGIIQGFLKVWSRWWTLVLLIEICGTVEKIKTSVWIYYIWDFLVTLGTRTGNDLGIISIYYRWWLWLYEWTRSSEGITKQEDRWVKDRILWNTSFRGAQVKKHPWGIWEGVIMRLRVELKENPIFLWKTSFMD